MLPLRVRTTGCRDPLAVHLRIVGDEVHARRVRDACPNSFQSTLSRDAPQPFGVWVWVCISSSEGRAWVPHCSIGEEIETGISARRRS